MAQKKTTWSEETKAALIVPLDEAREKISVQIQKGKKLLETQIGSEQQLGQIQTKCEYWYDFTVELLGQIFSTDELSTEFAQSRAALGFDGPGGFHQKVSWFREDFRGELERLISIHERLELYPVILAEQQQEPPGPIEAIALITQRFHTVARQLRQRHNSRPTLDVADEYDVQDLLHILLKIYFDDVRSEEYTPSYARGAARIGFLLKAERTVIEVKKTRQGLGDKEVGSQLIEDIGRYQAHPDCQTLICFVYDPDGRIVNPVGLEQDLSRTVNGMTVKVIVAPKGP